MLIVPKPYISPTQPCAVGQAKGNKAKLEKTLQEPDPKEGIAEVT